LATTGTVVTNQPLASIARQTGQLDDMMAKPQNKSTTYKKYSKRNVEKREASYYSSGAVRWVGVLDCTSKSRSTVLSVGSEILSENGVAWFVIKSD
jgi:hypothetical protein